MEAIFKLEWFDGQTSLEEGYVFSDTAVYTKVHPSSAFPSLSPSRCSETRRRAATVAAPASALPPPMVDSADGVCSALGQTAAC